MTKIHIVHTAPINPPSSSPRLTRAEAWTGLARKARHPEEFVPVVARCEILHNTAVSAAGTGTGADEEEIECIVHFRPGVPHAAQIHETCTLHAPCRLDYAMEDGSTAVNVIGVGPSLLAEGEGVKKGDGQEELYLTFAFCWEHVGLERGGEEEKVLRDRYEKVSFFLIVPFLFFSFLCSCLTALVVDHSLDRGHGCTGHNCWHEKASLGGAGVGRLAGCLMNGWKYMHLFVEPNGQ